MGPPSARLGGGHYNFGYPRRYVPSDGPPPSHTTSFGKDGKGPSGSGTFVHHPMHVGKGFGNGSSSKDGKRPSGKDGKGIVGPQAGIGGPQAIARPRPMPPTSPPPARLLALRRAEQAAFGDTTDPLGLEVLIQEGLSPGRLANPKPPGRATG